MQNIKKMTPEEITETLDKVQRLYEFYKNNKMSFFILGRKNGKSLLAYRFMKEYAAITTAYEKAERKAKKKYGYIPQSAAEQILYIIRYVVRDKLRSLRLRFKLWRKPKSDCYHCCIWCKHFESCRSEIESEEKQ